jgi:hypothetical protein
MKTIIENSDCEIIEQYLGLQITLFCCRYLYTGKLIAIDDQFLTLEDPKIVYETGSFEDNNWKDSQSLNIKKWNISLQSIESFGGMNKK